MRTERVERNTFRLAVIIAAAAVLLSATVVRRRGAIPSRYAHPVCIGGLPGDN